MTTPRMGRSAPPIEVLLVEDNPGDVRLTREALRGTHIEHELHIASDGVEALQFLGREGRFGEAARPDLILLDLNLPRLGGRDVLQTIKSDPALQTIPVVILTTSESPRDIAQSYQLRANCYVTKPVDLQTFTEVFHFWLSIARLPQEASS